MAAIALEVDTDLMRVGVTLSAWTNGNTVVYRQHADGMSYTVRGAQPFVVSGGVGFVWDYEPPFNEPVTYRADSGSSTITSAPVTVASEDAWLRAPGLPSLDMQVKLPGKPPQITHARPSSIRYPMGNSTPIVRSGARRAAQFDLTVRVRSDDEAGALERLLHQAPVMLLQVPLTRLAWRFVHVADANEVPVVEYGDVDDDPHRVGMWSDYLLTCVEVSRPLGDVFGDPSASYQAYLDEGLTYQDLTAYTYLDLLRGTPLGV